MILQLLNPWMLLGAVALSAPILIHLLTRHTPQTVHFPTLRFLRRALARQSRLMRMRHLLLLLLRLFLLALLVAAFAKPVLKLPFQKLMVTRGRSATLLALDVSLSMGYTGSGTTPLSRAKAEAIKVLQSLQSRDRANVLLVSASSQSVAPQMTRDLNLLREGIESAEATMEEADFNAALERAADEFGREGAKAVQKELYVISDFQRTNWAPVRLEAVPPDVNLYLVDVDSELKANTAVTELRLRPSSPRVGDVVEVSCEVANYSPEPREIPVQFELAGEQRLSQRVLAPTFGSATALFRLRPNRAGDHEGLVSIPADHLKADNVRCVALRLLKGLSVLLLTDESPDDDTTSAFYLLRALNPRRNQEVSLRVTVVNGKQALTRDLTSADVVFVSNLDYLEADLAEKLLDYMTNNGSVLYFLGGGQAEAQLARLNAASSSGPITPFTVTDLVDLHGMGRGYVTWAEARFESPMLSLFRDPEHGDLSKLKFFKFRLVRDSDERAEVLLKYEDRTPAAARRRVGGGSFVLCNFSPHPQFSDMMKHEVFPPLLHELVKGALAEESASQDFRVGHVASTAFEDYGGSAQPSLAFSDPRGEQTTARWQRTGGRLSVLFETTPQPGFYRVRLNGREAAAAAVNVSPDESDLRELEGAELAAKQRMERHAYSVRADADPAHVERLRRGRELWHVFLLAALLVALAEHGVAWWMRTK